MDKKIKDFEEYDVIIWGEMCKQLQVKRNLSHLPVRRLIRFGIFAKDDVRRGDSEVDFIALAAFPNWI